MKRILLTASVVTFLTMVATPNSYADSWNGFGPITAMYIYPTYAVVIQGPTSAGQAAGCNSTNSWSFYWSDFDSATQGRIQSMLLSAYLSGKGIMVGVSSTACGPESLKKFNGQFYLG